MASLKSGTENDSGSSTASGVAASAQSQTSTSASQVLSRRIVTALVGGTVFFGLVTAAGVGGCHLVVLFLTYKMAQEFASILFKGGLQEEKSRTFIWTATGLAVLGAFKHGSMELSGLGFVILASYYLLRAKRFHGANFQNHLQEMIVACFALMYLDLILYLPVLRSLPKGNDWMELFVGAVWITDTAAYFGGRLMGHRKLFPTVSPNKTIEGSLSAIACCLAFALAYKFLRRPDLGLVKILIVTTLTGLATQTGDLVESFLKRGLDVKDMGSGLPGHGGYLDRFDGFIFALPVAIFLIRIIP